LSVLNKANMIAAVGFSRMSSQNTPISKEQRNARAKKDDEARERRKKWVNYMISVRNLIRTGNVEEFAKSFTTNPEGVDAIINRPWTAYPSALHLAVLSKSPEMVSEVVSITSPVNIDYIDSNYSDTPYIEPYTDAEINLCSNKSARSVADELLKTGSENDKANLKKIKSILIQNGAKQKTRMGFTVFPENAENVKVYKAKQKTSKQGGSRTRKTRSQRSRRH
jgi:hypothetical protein